VEEFAAMREAEFAKIRTLVAKAGLKPE